MRVFFARDAIALTRPSATLSRKERVFDEIANLAASDLRDTESAL
jgi:hypothetical protein